ncbi:MAG: C25 family peptidase propeptide domain-containing protein, partial [Ignavibacteria bacterium]|nr:C25 family peptidase propeptide domain-containing protein [Ignavibacteria bacterium]
MKKISLLFSVILLSLVSYAGEWTSIKSEKPAAIQQKLLNSNEENIVIQFTIDGFYSKHVTTHKGKAVIISVAKMVSLSEVGAPDVPKYAVSSIIGDQADMDVRVITSKYVDYQNIEIAPSKGDFSRNIDPATVPFTYGSIYNNDAFYPSINAELQEPYILRNYRGQAVTIMPFVYNPITKTLRVFYDLTIELFKTGTGGANQLTRNTNTNKADYEFKHLYSRQFINFQEATNRYPIVEEQGNLLIISHGPYMEAMQPFVEWKKTIGRPTQIVDVATIGTTSLAIRDYVLNYYNTNGLTHLIIVGDHQHVPSYNNTASGGYSDN